MVHSTRATDRVCILMEDLRDGVKLPRRGCLRKRSLALGLRARKDEFTNRDDALVRRHLFLVGLYRVCKRVWRDLNVSSRAAYTIGRPSIRYLPTILTSNIVRDALKLSSASLDTVHELMLCCAGCYGRMARWWPETTDYDEEKILEKQTRDRTFWQQVVTSAVTRNFLPNKKSSPWVEAKQLCRPEASFSG